jgi:hypothetical protein
MCFIPAIPISIIVQDSAFVSRETKTMSEVIIGDRNYPVEDESQGAWFPQLSYLGFLLDMQPTRCEIGPRNICFFTPDMGLSALRWVWKGHSESEIMEEYHRKMRGVKDVITPEQLMQTTWIGIHPLGREQEWKLFHISEWCDFVGSVRPPLGTTGWQSQEYLLYLYPFEMVERAKNGPVVTD